MSSGSGKQENDPLKSSSSKPLAGDIAGLFQAHVRNLKPSGANGQYSGHCCFHEDANPSFSVNLESGLCRCFGCDFKGDAAGFALKLGLDPKPYYKGGNGSPPPDIAHTSQPPKETPLPESEIEKARNWYAYLRDNFDRLTKGLPWSKEAVEKAGVGYDPDTGRFVYVHRDSQGRVMNIKHGKGRGGQVPYSVQGYGQTRLFPAHLLKGYTPDFVIYCEGEPDVVTLLSHGFQAITGTTGAGSIPPDLRPLSKFGATVVLQDHDKAGMEGSVKIADAILSQNPGVEVFISYWPESSPEGFDITDYFKNGGTADGFEEMMLKEIPIYQPTKQEMPAQEKPKEITLRVRKPTYVRMSDVEPEAVQWLWPPYIPLGKLTILEGDPGVGKTWLALQLAGIISRGNPFPGSDGIPGESGEVANVIYMSAEDGLADTLRPRLDAAGADTVQVIALTGWSEQTDEGELTGQVTLQDIPTIEQILAEFHPALLVVDPLQGFFGRDIDFHRANETRPILAALGQLAEKYKTAVLCIRHLGKSRQDRAVYRGLGSIDFAAAARSILLVGHNPDNTQDNTQKRVMAHVKSSLAPTGPSIGFELTEGQFLWTGVSDVSVEALLAPRSSEDTTTALEEAKAFLQEILADGPIPSEDILREAGELGISEKTLRRAKEVVGVRTWREGEPGGERGRGKWLWGLKSD